jgi:hypothetical protein
MGRSRPVSFPPTRVVPAERLPPEAPGTHLAFSRSRRERMCFPFGVHGANAHTASGIQPAERTFESMCGIRTFPYGFGDESRKYN